MNPLTTPDGRYLIVRGRLWRTTNPALSEHERERLVHALMDARRAVKPAKASGDGAALAAARQEVDIAKRGLGERGPVWWTDGAPCCSRHWVKSSPMVVRLGLMESRFHSRTANGNLHWSASIVDQQPRKGVPDV